MSTCDNVRFRPGLPHMCLLVCDVHPCDGVRKECIAIILIFSNCIWGTEPDARQRRELQCGPGKGVDHEAGNSLVAGVAEAKPVKRRDLP